MQQTPLQGLKVVEIGVAMAGPFCGMMFGDYGAELIKVERIGQGDESRNWGPFFPGKVAHYFASVNRSKKSLALDLKQPEGVEILRRLVRSADVVIDNFRLGALDALGLGYESLSVLNPRLIYCSISGYGASGPLREERANDVVMQAYAGGMSITGEPGRGPVKMGISVADIGAGMFGVIGVLMALNVREKTGRGQRVDTSLMEGQISMLSYHYAAYFASGQAPQRMGSSAQGLVPYQAFEAKDDWMVVAVFTDRMWCDLATAIGRPELGADPRFATPPARRENRAEVIAIVSAVFAQHPVAFWVEKLNAVGVPCTPVRSIDQAVQQDQVKARDMIVPLEHPTAGTLHLAGLPIKLSETPGAVVAPPPLLGQHTNEILVRLGYDQGTIDQYVSSRIVGIPEQ